MKVIIAALGTHGDIIPLVGLGRELQTRGHSITLLSNEVFRDHVESNGLGFKAIADAQAYQRAFGGPDVWEKRGAAGHFFNAQHLGAIAPGFDYVESCYKEDQDLIVIAINNAYGVRYACEKYDIPWIAVSLTPNWIRSCESPPHPIPSWLPKKLVALCYWWADRFMLDPYILKPLNKSREQLGLPDIRRVFHSWDHSACLHLGLYPDWFARPAKDWPAQIRTTAFPLWHQSSGAGNQAVADFIKDHGPPLVFTTGTGVVDVDGFFQASTKLCKALNTPGIFLSLHPIQLPPEPGIPILHVNYADLEQVLPFSCAFIHHGGMGSCSQAFQAGIPQLISPIAFDQPDNARRIKSLGLGDSISRKDYLAGKALKKLTVLIHSTEVRKRTKCTAKITPKSGNFSIAIQHIEALERAYTH